MKKFSVFINKNIRYIKWILFTAVITALPLGADYFLRVWNNQIVIFSSLIKGGQLLLISCCLSASGFGEVISHKSRDLDFIFSKLIIGFFVLITLLASAITYGSIAARFDDPNFRMTGTQVQIQIIFFVASFLSGLSAQKFAQ
jgi:hypothetical protein